MSKVLMVGSAEQSGGGVASVLRLMKTMPFWEKYHCGWLGTQIQRGYGVKLWYAVKAYFKALFTIWQYDIVHFHTVPDKICLIIQMPVLLLALLGKKKIVMHIHMGNQLEDHTHNRLFIWCLNRADCVVLLAKKWQKCFAEWFPTVKAKTAVIYNACAPTPAVDYSMKEKSIIMAAFLNDNKHPDLLLQAWKNLKADFPDWHVTIMGMVRWSAFKLWLKLWVWMTALPLQVISPASKRRMSGIKQASIVCAPVMRVSLWWFWKLGQEVLL